MLSTYLFLISALPRTAQSRRSLANDFATRLRTIQRLSYDNKSVKAKRVVSPPSNNAVAVSVVHPKNVSRDAVTVKAWSHDACSCVIDGAESHQSLEVWLNAAVHQEGLERCCFDYGSLFGRWGVAACPQSLQNVLESVKHGAQPAAGGKSGTKPIITSEYVIKVISAEEEKQQRRLLDYLAKGFSELTYLTPACRILQVTKQKYIQISPNLKLRDSNLSNHLTFDLKGNWGWANRKANDTEKILKDANFHERFPRGLRLHARGELFPNGLRVTKEDAIGQYESMITFQLNQDTQRLLELGLMDYSLLLDMIKLDGLTDDEIHALTHLNRDKPLVWAIDDDESRYLMSFGVIDQLMHETERGAGNALAANLCWNPESGGIGQWLGFAYTEKKNTWGCYPACMDPIPAKPYRVRFLRMFGYRDPRDAGKIYYGARGKYKPYCGACLGNRQIRIGSSAVEIEDPTKEYTYFTTAHQKNMSAKNHCEWAGP